MKSQLPVLMLLLCLLPPCGFASGSDRRLPNIVLFLTGKYPARLKLTDWLGGRKDYPFQRLANAQIHKALPLEETTLAEALKQHGYRTALFGKWHLGEAPAGPLAQGFDVQVPANWFKGWPKAGYYHPFKFEGLGSKPGDYLTDRLTDEALKFIEESSDVPFFLYLSHFAVHDPIQGRPDLVGKYAGRRAQLPPDKRPFILEGDPDTKPSSSFTRGQLDEMIDTKAYAGYRTLPNRLVKIKQRQDNPQFAAMVESVDQSLGRVIAKLKAHGLEQNTIIILTSDNGGMAAANFHGPGRVIHPAQLDAAYSTSNLPLRGAKGWMNEGGIRVPLIIKSPGRVPAGLVVGEPVTGTDYYPTHISIMNTTKVMIIGAAAAAFTMVAKADPIPPDTKLEYPKYARKSDDRSFSRSEYGNRLQGFWLGQCIANWTGLRTEGVRKTAPFFTDEDWGTKQGKKDKLNLRHTGITTDGYNYRSWFDAGINFGASLISLFYGEGDLKRTIQIGSLCGYDSDNPTATWGGLLGFMMGPDAIEQAFGGKKLSRLYQIGRTRINFPDRTPDQDGDDSFELMARRGVQIIDRVVIEEMGGGVDLEKDVWLIPGTGGEITPAMTVQKPKAPASGQP